MGTVDRTVASSTCLLSLSRAKAKRFLSGSQKALLTRDFCFSNAAARSLLSFSFPARLGEIRERAQGFRSQAALVELGFYREQRAAFHPAVSESKILRQALRVIGGAHELIGLPQAVPLGFGEGGVAALRDVIVHGDDVERGGVGGSVRVGIIGEPVDEICALRDFVRDFSVVALVFADEFEGFARAGEIAVGVEGEGSPHGIAAEKPGEAGALAFSGGAVAGDESGAEIGIGDHALNHADARPVVGALELLVGEIHANGLR